VENGGRRVYARMLGVAGVVAALVTVVLGDGDRAAVIKATPAAHSSGHGGATDSSGLRDQLNQEIADRQAADEALREAFEAEFEARSGEVDTLRAELASADPFAPAVVQVNSHEIVDGAVTSADLADETVITADLADGAVTTAKLAGGAVTLAKVDAGSLDGVFATDAQVAAEAGARSAAELALRTPVNGGVPNGGEALVEWSRLAGVPAGFADNVDDDGSTAAHQLRGELSTADTNNPSAPNDGDGLVQWTNLEGIDEAIVRRLAADVECSACVSSDEIASLDAVKLSGTIDGSQISVGSITGSHLAASAVTSDKIQDASITSDDLAFGAVTTGKQTANAASGLGGFALVDNDPGSSTPSDSDLVSALVSLPESGFSHRILVTGQTQLRCDPCGSEIEVEYEVVRRQAGDANVVVGPTYRTTVGAGRIVVAPVSVTDSATQNGGAPVEYVLRARVLGSDAGAVTFESSMINAVDLGRG